MMLGTLDWCQNLRPSGTYEWLRYVVYPALFYMGTKTGDTKRDYAAYQLFHTLTNVEIFVRAVGWTRTYGLKPLSGVAEPNQPTQTHQLLRKNLMAWLGEIVWMIKVKEWNVLLTHHVAVFCFAPYAFKWLPPQTFTMGLLDIQTLPKLLYVVQAWTGLPYEGLKRWTHWIRPVLILGFRIPLMLKMIRRSRTLAPRLLGAVVVAHDLRTIRKTIAILRS